MFLTPEDLIKTMRQGGLYHWELYRTYNSNNPQPIVTSEHLGKGEDIDPEKSLRLLSDTFNMLGPGQYYIKYNTKCYFNKGAFAADVTNRQVSASPSVTGIGALPAGYVSPSELDLRLKLMQQEFENKNLQNRIGSLEKGEGSKTLVEQIIDYAKADPNIGKGIGELISSFANKMNPQVIRQTSTIGTTGFDKKQDEKKDEQQVPEPEHIHKLTDEEFEKGQSDMLENCIALWYIDPDFPTLLPKLLLLAKEQPAKYGMAKTML